MSGQRLSLVALTNYGKQSKIFRTGQPLVPIPFGIHAPWARLLCRSPHTKRAVRVCRAFVQGKSHPVDSAAIAELRESALDCAQSGEQERRLVPWYIPARISVDFAGRPHPPTNARHKKAREDAIPHERGSLPVLPFEIFSLLSPFPKLASAARPPATRHSSTGCPLIPLTLGHLNLASIPPPECLALLQPADACVPFC